MTFCQLVRDFTIIFKTEQVNWVLRCALLIYISPAVCSVSVFSVIMNLFGNTLHELHIYNFIRKDRLATYTRPNAFFFADKLFTPQKSCFVQCFKKPNMFTFHISCIMYFYSVIKQSINVPLYKCGLTCSYQKKKKILFL